MKICCSHCDVHGHADDKYAGKELRCPKCNGRFLAQATSETHTVIEDDSSADPYVDEEKAIKGQLDTPAIIPAEDEESEPHTLAESQDVATESLIPVSSPDDRIDSVGDGLAGKSEMSEKYSTPSEQVVAEHLINEEVIEFSFGSLCGEAWRRTKGVKGTIWAAIGMMYLVMFVLGAACATVLPEEGFLSVGAEVALSVVSSFFFTSLVYMGIVVARSQPLHWKMIFTSFPCWRRLLVTCCLQWVFIVIGFLLLILPGIYLSVGYTYAMLLVVDKGLSPWQAMEASRKVIHKIWWKMFGLYIAVGLVMFLATIPLGIGLIWFVPWSLVLMGLLYHFLFTEDPVGSV